MTKAPSSELPAVAPLREVPTDQDDRTDGRSKTDSEKLDEILRILRRHESELSSIRDRMTKLEANVALWANETQRQGGLLSNLNQTCAQRCSALERLVTLDEKG